MAHSGRVFQDEVEESPRSTSFGGDKAIVPVLTGDEGGETPFSDLNEYQTSSCDVNHEVSYNDTQPSELYSFFSASNELASTSDPVSPSKDGCEGPSLLTGTAASPLTLQSLIEVYNGMQGCQKQDDFSSKCIDPQLLYIRKPEDKAIESLPAFTLHTQPDLGISPPPTSAPAASRDDNYSAITPAYCQPPEASPQRTRPVSSRGRKVRVRTPNLSPRHKKRRAGALKGFTQHRHYHSLPTSDREYFDRVVEKLNNASYLGSPQSREPTVGSEDGYLLVGVRRLTGPGAATARESVYAVLVDRPSEGDFVCWICGETRSDRRLVRAIDHLRGHFEHRPYHCSSTHLDQRTGSGSASSLPLAAVCGQSFTCAEALKDHEAKMKNKSHSCDACEKTYTTSANLKRHLKKAHHI